MSDLIANAALTSQEPDPLEDLSEEELSDEDVLGGGETVALPEDPILSADDAADEGEDDLGDNPDSAGKGKFDATTDPSEVGQLVNAFDGDDDGNYSDLSDAADGDDDNDGSLVSVDGAAVTTDHSEQGQLVNAFRGDDYGDYSDLDDAADGDDDDGPGKIKGNGIPFAADAASPLHSVLKAPPTFTTAVGKLADGPVKTLYNNFSKFNVKADIAPKVPVDCSVQFFRIREDSDFTKDLSDKRLPIPIFSTPKAKDEMHQLLQAVVTDDGGGPVQVGATMFILLTIMSATFWKDKIYATPADLIAAINDAHKLYKDGVESIVQKVETEVQEYLKALPHLSRILNVCLPDAIKGGLYPPDIEAAPLSPDLKTCTIFSKQKSDKKTTAQQYSDMRKFVSYRLTYEINRDDELLKDPVQFAAFACEANYIFTNFCMAAWNSEKMYAAIVDTDISTFGDVGDISQFSNEESEYASSFFTQNEDFKTYIADNIRTRSTSKGKSTKAKAYAKGIDIGSFLKECRYGLRQIANKINSVMNAQIDTWTDRDSLKSLCVKTYVEQLPIRADNELYDTVDNLTAVKEKMAADGTSPLFETDHYSIQFDDVDDFITKFLEVCTNRPVTVREFRSYFIAITEGQKVSNVELENVFKSVTNAAMFLKWKPMITKWVTEAQKDKDNFNTHFDMTQILDPNCNINTALNVLLTFLWGPYSSKFLTSQKKLYLSSNPDSFFGKDKNIYSLILRLNPEIPADTAKLFKGKNAVAFKIDELKTLTISAYAQAVLKFVDEHSADFQLPKATGGGGNSKKGKKSNISKKTPSQKDLESLTLTLTTTIDPFLDNIKLIADSITVSSDTPTLTAAQTQLLADNQGIENAIQTMEQKLLSVGLAANSDDLETAKKLVKTANDKDNEARVVLDKVENNLIAQRELDQIEGVSGIVEAARVELESLSVKVDLLVTGKDLPALILNRDAAVSKQKEIETSIATITTTQLTNATLQNDVFRKKEALKFKDQMNAIFKRGQVIVALIQQKRDALEISLMLEHLTLLRQTFDAKKPIIMKAVNEINDLTTSQVDAQQLQTNKVNPILHDPNFIRIPIDVPKILNDNLFKDPDNSTALAQATAICGTILAEFATLNSLVTSLDATILSKASVVVTAPALGLPPFGAGPPTGSTAVTGAHVILANKLAKVYLTPTPLPALGPAFTKTAREIVGKMNVKALETQNEIAQSANHLGSAADEFTAYEDMTNDLITELNTFSGGAGGAPK